ncbi:MAG: molybdopterin molybdotransferase MoeA [Anaerolineae bacterium]|nr:molybdopterin molybdotransferase MoeA [Gloeobacterales cyanobacterium ES-bin-313]
MISVEEAQELILAAVQVAPPERLDLLSARGRVLAETVTARQDFPPYDNSAMDGYAVRSQDGPALQVIGTVAAGQVPDFTVGSGQAVRIMTGAMVPTGADAVVMQENVRAEGVQIVLAQAPQSGSNIRRQGEFNRSGSALLKPGAILGPGEIAILAAAQRSFVMVHRAPTVAILSTGNELVGIDGTLSTGQIVDSNQYGIAAQIAEAGGVPRLLGIAPDDPDQIRASVEAALSADFVLTSGGASVGQFDYLPKVLADLGAEVVLYKINMKPGKPLMFAKLGDRQIWGLPGNPVSSLFCFWQFVRPAIRKRLGYPESAWRLPVISAALSQDLRAKGDRRAYLRGRVQLTANGWQFAPYRTDNSGDLVSLAGINGFAWLEAGITSATAGSQVPVVIVGEITN